MSTDVFINNKFVGTVNGDPKEFVDTVIDERRNNEIDSEVNIVHDETKEAVYVETARGRTTRPLIVVEDGEPLLTDDHVDELEDGDLTWSDLVKDGIVEYLDAMEEERALVAFDEDEITEDHTHLEVTSLSIFGLTASMVPFGNFNQGVRLNQGAKNQKQGLGFYAANYHVRLDTNASVLHYPQTPLVKSVMHDIAEYDRHPSGQNVTVAIMTYKGYNMEDALVINQGSVDRGLARSSFFNPVSSEELSYSGGLKDEISIPDKDVRGYKSEEAYRLLEEDGVVYPEAEVEEDDVVIGKVSPPRFLSTMDEYSLTNNVQRESSKSLGHGKNGRIDHVSVTESDEGNKLVQVRIREQRIPEIGDKFTSRHGQKGVLSIVVPEDNVPFTGSGYRPDIIFSPHGIPSRMSISHLLETLGGKTAALRGKPVDGTMFQSEGEDEIRDQLRRLGFKPDGTETMYNGITGEQYDVPIYIGNIYYLRLKHMVANKIQSRARGPIQLLTRQPTEGKAKEGGLRLGEMEKDTLVAHGASLTLKERFNADNVVVPVDERSGLVGYYDARKNNQPMSPVNGEDGEMSNVEISYAFNLFLNELKSLGMYPKLQLSSKF